MDEGKNQTNNKILSWLIATISFVVFVNNSPDIEEISKPLVNQILRKQYNLNRLYDDQ